MNIFRSKYIKNFFSLLFFISIVWIVLDSILRTTISSYLLEEKIFLGIIGAIYLIYFILQICIKKINAVSILFLVLVVISIISSLNNGLSFGHCYTSVFYHLSVIFVFSYFSSYKKNLHSKFRFILYLLSFVLLCYSSISLLIYILTKYYNVILPFETWSGMSVNNRLYGITGNPASTGVLACMGIICQFYLWVSIKNKVNIFYHIMSMIIIFIDTTVLILSDARGSIIASFILSLLLIIYFLKHLTIKNNFIKYSIIVLFTVIVSSFCLFIICRLVGMNREINYKTLDNWEKILETISSKRYSIWKETIIILKSSPLIGIGIDNLINCAKFFLKDSVIVSYQIEGPHNVLLDVAVSSGLIGLAIALVIFFFIFRSCYILMKKQYTLSNVVLVAGIVGMFIISLFDYGIFFRGRFMSPLFWMFSGYAYCLSKRVKS